MSPSNPLMPAKTRFIKLNSLGERFPIADDEWAGVLDLKTKLIWAVATSERMTQYEAELAAKKTRVCGKLGRLPTLDELESLRDLTRYSPAINVNFFPGTQSDWYWTSTPAAYSPDVCAWGRLLQQRQRALGRPWRPRVLPRVSNAYRAAMIDSLEIYRDGEYSPFVKIDSSFQPNDGDLINIKKVTYVVLGRSFTIDHMDKQHRSIRCNVIVEEQK